MSLMNSRSLQLGFKSATCLRSIDSAAVNRDERIQQQFHFAADFTRPERAYSEESEMVVLEMDFFAEIDHQLLRSEETDFLTVSSISWHLDDGNMHNIFLLM
jgi:hypothetical protein